MLESLLSLARSYTGYYDSSSAGWIVVILVVALIALLIFLRFVPLGLWITSLAAGVHVSIASLVGMRLRRIQPKRLVEPLIKARKAGLSINLSRLTFFLQLTKTKLRWPTEASIAIWNTLLWHIKYFSIK